MREGGAEMSQILVNYCEDAEDKKGTEDMVDPFYSDANMAYLARITSEIDSGKSHVDQLRAEIAYLKENIANGKQPVFDSIDALIDKLEES